jgi:hypothetical protein
VVDGFWFQGDALLMLDSGNRFTALDLDSGKVLWVADPPFGGAYGASVVLFADRAILGTEAATWAVSLADGRILWTFAGLGLPRTSYHDLVAVVEPEFESGNLVHRSGIRFLSAANGEERGRFGFGGAPNETLVHSAKAYGDCLVLQGNYLSGTSLNGDACQWQQGEPYGFAQNVHYGQDAIYTDADYPEEGVWRLEPAAGEPQLVTRSPFPDERVSIVRQYAKNGDRLYIASTGRARGDLDVPDTILQAIDGAAHEAWKTAMARDTVVFRLAAGQDLVVGQGFRLLDSSGEDGRPEHADVLISWDAKDGRELWRWETRQIQTFALAGDTIAVSWFDGDNVNGMTIDATTGEAPLGLSPGRA